MKDKKKALFFYSTGRSLVHYQCCDGPMGPVLFSIFLNDLEKRVIIEATKFADDAELFMVIKTKADREELWKALMILCD